MENPSEKLSLLMLSLEVEDLGFNKSTTALAALAVRLGGRKIQRLYGQPKENLGIQWKAKDGDTAATIADRESEASMIALIQREYPGARIITEESELIEGKAGQIEVLQDPLDGTSPFLDGELNSTVAIGISHEGKMMSAAVCKPLTYEMVLAEENRGVRYLRLNERLTIEGNGREVHTAEGDDLRKKSIYFDALLNEKTSGPKLDFLRRVQMELAGDSMIFLRATGSNIDQQIQVASGRAMASLTDAVGGFWDLAIGGFIVQQAGGVMTDLDGNPVTPETQVALASANDTLHRKLLAIAQECYKGYTGFR